MVQKNQVRRAMLIPSEVIDKEKSLGNFPTLLSGEGEANHTEETSKGNGSSEES